MGEQCGYEIPWWGVCKKPRPCKDHAHLKCIIKGCGKQATHACPTMGQFMCGAPLCAKHERCCR